MHNKKGRMICAAIACALATGAIPSLVACDGNGEYTVTFDTRGGSTVSSLKLDEGASVKRPKTVPTKEMFVFDNWYVDAACTELFDFATFKMPADNVVVYAGWLDADEWCKVTFDANGGAFDGRAETFVSVDVVGAALTAPENPVREGYTFGGWYTEKDGGSAYTFDKFPSENLTLYAKWNG